MKTPKMKRMEMIENLMDTINRLEQHTKYFAEEVSNDEILNLDSAINNLNLAVMYTTSIRRDCLETSATKKQSISRWNKNRDSAIIKAVKCITNISPI